MLSKNLESLVPRTTRERGRGYYNLGKVKIVLGDAWLVEARVRGTSTYDVTLERLDNAIEAQCTCPYCGDSLLVCKHIWATLLAAEAQGYLSGSGRRSVTNLQVVVPDELDEFGDEVWFDPPEPSPPPRPVKPSAGPRPSSPRTRKTAEAWKKMLSRLQSEAESTASARVDGLPPGHEVVYIIDRPASLARGGLVLDVATRYRKKNGEWSKPQGRRFSLEAISTLPDPSDRQALAMLAGGREQVGGYSYGYSYAYYDQTPARYVLRPELSKPLLPLLGATGRCFLRTSESDGTLQPLCWDAAGPWDFWLKATRERVNAPYSIVGELRRGDERRPLDAPLLVLAGGYIFWDDCVAPLNDSDAFSWISLLRQQGSLTVPVRQQKDFLVELFRLPKLPPLDLPDELNCTESSPAPRPFLTIKPRGDRSVASTRDQNWLVGELAFDYDGHVVAARSAVHNVFLPEERRLLKRDMAAERTLAARLEQLGFRRKVEYHRGETLELAAKQLPKVARTLLQEDWRVEVEGKLYRQPGEFRVEVSSGIDWFELHGGVTFGEHEVPLPTLLAALKRGESFVPLGDGSFGVLPEEWLKKYLTLHGVGTAEEDHLRFRKTQVGILDVLLAERPEARFDEQFEQARERLRRFEGIAPADPPAGFEGQLRGYQGEGLGWLHFLREFGFGGCLADDMGLGKTIQVLALLESRRALRVESDRDDPPPPSLVVVPRSLVFNWKQEAARFTPELRLLDYTGLERGKVDERFGDFDVILTTYGTLRRDIVELKDYRFDYAILDEAQAIKNASSQSAKAARLIQADHRLALSGTPVENHLGELWSLFEFLNPGMLGNADVDLRKAGEETRTLLARALRPYLLRRTKEQVAKDLPAKLEQTIYCDLEPPQRRLYDELREHYRDALLGRAAAEGLAKSKIQILEALLRLRQAACHPGLIDKRRAKPSGEPSAKLDVLLPLLREVFDEGHKTLVFSQFTSMLAIVKQRLDEEKIPYVYLDGRTRDRQARVQQFQDDPDCKVFLISLKAGGVGLNLTAADYIFLLDPWWNPAVESQAIDRAHRIGQTRPVFAYRLIARGTVEEKVLLLQEQKRALADAILTADNSLIRDLSREDLELLLS